MDPVLSSLFPVHQIGSDGFNWWIGQVEDIDDPKKGARVRVRIVGQHLKECDAVPTEELPWASVVMPVTTPYSDGGVSGASSNLKVGNWVIGFYLDSDKQKPVVIGSVGHVPGSTKILNDDPNPGGKCKAFTTYIPEELNPATDLPASEQSGTASADNEVGYEEGTKITGAEPLAASRSNEEGGLPPALLGAFKQNTETNSTGGKFCVAIANPNCGSEQNLKSNLTRIVGEMLATNQASSGQLGDYYVSKATGALNEQVSTGRYHINRVVRLVRSSVARAKGEIITELRNGVKELIDFSLYETQTQIIPDDINQPLTGAQLDAIEAADIAREEALLSGDADAIESADDEYNSLLEEVSGQRGHPTIKKKKVSRLKAIQNFLDNALKEIGCSIADITEKLAQWLTDLLLGYLEDAYNAVACLIDELINGILNEIIGLIDTLINSILGGLQSILSNIAQPINIIGGILKRVMDILGISCTGPEAQCERIQIKCTDCSSGAVDEDFLDKLIKTIEDGDLDFSNNVCDEATFYPEVEPTSIIFVGGVFQPPNVPNSSGYSPSPINPNSPNSYGTINYTCSDIQVDEGQQAVFTIVRSGSINVSSSLTFNILDGSAVAGSDYDVITTGNTIPFSPSETTKQVVIDTYKDAQYESAEKFFLQLSNSVIPSGHRTSFPNGSVFECIINKLPSIPSSSTGTIAPPRSQISPVIGSSLINSPVPNVATSITPIVPPDQDNDTPTYFVSADKLAVNEGETITYTITTTNVATGTIISYTLSGNNITESDIEGQTLVGNFVIDSSGSSVVQITIREDSNIEEAELLRFNLDGIDVFADVVINADTEIEPPPLIDPNLIPSYFVISDKELYKEGENIIYTITTENIPDETVFTYSLYGANISPEDFVLRTLSGSFTISGNKAIVTIGIEEDTEIEGDEILTFIINGTTAATDVTILGQIKDPQQDDDPIVPCLTKPTAEAIVDQYGKLLSIGIDDKGCPYAIPPKVIIGGNGYGAAAIPLLDDDGYVSEIRITRTGINYKPNYPEGLNCIIDSFTMLRPGSGYTSEPTVYVNELENIARAKIQNGFVISIEILDRTIPFLEMPRIRIVGGGGRGAKFLPNLTCLPVEELEARGYAKIGTGKYIDCP